MHSNLISPLNGLSRFGDVFGKIKRNSISKPHSSVQWGEFGGGAIFTRSQQKKNGPRFINKCQRGFCDMVSDGQIV